LLVVVEFRNVYKEIRCWFIMNGKKFLVIGLLSLFMISMFAGVASAADPLEGLEGGDGAFWTDVTNFLKGGFAEGSEGGAIFSRILLIILVVLLVYSIAGVLPFIGDSPNKEFIKWSISIVVAILSFIYVTEETVRALLVNYEALGIMLTTIIPLVILIAFVIQLSRESPFTAHIVNPILTVGFVAYILIRWVSIPASPLRIVYPITLVLLIIWLIFYKKIMKWVGVTETKTLVTKYKEESKMAKLKQEEDAKRIKEGSGFVE
jgi:hypothetical protein